MFSSDSDKVKLFAKKFFKNSNLDDSGISFPSITNKKLHNTCITPKMVKKVILSVDSSKVSGPDCIPVVVLRNCEPELSYILADLFNMCLKESCLPDCLKVSLGKGLLLKAIALLVFFLCLVKSLKNYRIVNYNRIVDHLEKSGFFSYFQYGFRSSQTTSNLLTVMSDRIAFIQHDVTTLFSVGKNNYNLGFS